jgi:hypothetical protein
MSTKRRGLKLEVVAPCSEDWNQMSGGDDIRFCGKCRQNVYNLSELTESQASELVQGPVCVRFFHRGDGTVITRKCSPMMEAARRRLVSLAAGTLAVLPLAVGFWGSVAWLRKLVNRDDPGSGRTTGGPRPMMGEAVAVRDQQPHILMGLLTEASPPAPRPLMGKPARPPIAGRVRHKTK